MMDKNFFEAFLINWILPVFVVLLIALTISLIYYRLRFAYISFQKKRFLPKISDALTELTFSGYQGEVLQAEVTKFKSAFPYRKKWFRKLVLSSLIDLSLTLKGNLIYQIRDIYIAFELHKYSAQLLKSWFWHTKCNGMYHFQSFHFVDSLKYIRPLLTSKNKVLRSNAFVAYLYLTTKPFDILIDYPFFLSRVNEYKVLDVIYMKKEPMPNNIDKYLESTNESVIILGLKVMVFYNYTGAEATILHLINHRHYRIREEAIHAVRELFFTDAEELLLKQFYREDQLLKIEILKSLTVIGGESTLSFIIKNLTLKSLGKGVKMELLKCLKAIDPSYYNTNFMLDIEIDKMKLHLNTTYL
ncbi:HEAT repeat domain-containing protein [Nonlabens sp. MB-3u-79]|uniref:HEAT repeat domain-containing protein n=1 Tax=Nonlabens sp. MB-3u-79 TaxID=2058134 RepID=UPI0012FE58DD|nr:hypothetical protein [Nonlabens sp. MB-3u-79]